MTNDQDQMIDAYHAFNGGVSQPVDVRVNAREVRVNCPFHVEDTPSCHLYEDHYHCFACSSHGTAVDFLRRTRYFILPDREGYAKAYADLGMARTQGTAPRSPGPRRQSVATWRAEAQRVVEHTKPPTHPQMTALRLAAGLYYERLSEGAHTMARLYAERRHLIPEDGIPLSDVGYCSGLGLQEVLAAHEERHGATGLADAARTIGLLDQKGRERLRGRITIADRNARSETIWMTGRAVPGVLPTQAAEERKYLHLSIERPLFGAGDADGEKEIVVVEGPVCALLLRELGIPAVALLGKSLPARHVPWFYGKTVLLCLDNPTSDKDAASLAQAQETLIAQLEGAASSIDILELPPGFKDPSEFIERYGVFPMT